jgi:hypothetical protein
MKLFKKNKVKIKDSFVNRASGAGSKSDKNTGSFFSNDGLSGSKLALEESYVESWAAAKIIDIPVDDMFIYSRNLINVNSKDRDTIHSFYVELSIESKIKKAIKASRLYGSAFMILISDDDLLINPLNTNNRSFNLKNIIVVDRFNTSILNNDNDIMSTNFNKPLVYRFNIINKSTLDVHHSRVIRVDGITSLSEDGFQSHDRNFGVSELVRCMSVITKEESLASGVNQMIQEASVPIIKVPDFKDSMAGAPDEASPDQLATEINSLKSVYRTLYLDSEMDVSRLEVNFSNIPDMFDKYHTRLSAAADIPATRFFGTSPLGLGSTGDHESGNYATKIASMQNNILRSIFDKLDKIMINSLKLNIEFRYDFDSIVDISEEVKADVYLKKAQANQIYIQNGVVTVEDIAQSLMDSRDFTDLSVDNSINVVSDEAIENIKKTMLEG